MRSVRWMGVVLCVAAAVLCAPEDAGADQEAPDFTSLRAQASHYMKKKQFSRARELLGQAVELPGGTEDFRTNMLLARVLYEELVLELAVPAARKALGLAKTSRDREKATSLLERIEEFFAGVEVVQDEKQRGQVQKGLILLEDLGGLISLKKKAAFEKIRVRFEKEPVELPLTIFLPFGSYKANGAQFAIEPGEVAKAVTFLYLPDNAMADGPGAWWYIGGGVAVVGAAAAAVLLLAPSGPVERQLTFTGITTSELREAP